MPEHKNSNHLTNGAALLAGLGWISSFGLIWCLLLGFVTVTQGSISALFFFFLVSVAASAIASSDVRKRRIR